MSKYLPPGTTDQDVDCYMGGIEQCSECRMENTSGCPYHRTAEDDYDTYTAAREHEWEERNNR